MGLFIKKLLELIFLINKIDTIAMAAFFLQQLRRSEQFDIEVPKQDMSALLNTNRTSSTTYMHQKQNRNPFAGKSNPFARRR